MKNLKIINQEDLKDWAKEIFKKNSFNMVDVSSKKETHYLELGKTGLTKNLSTTGG